MKRDLELIVKLLREIEALPPSQSDVQLPILAQGSVEDRLLMEYHLNLVIGAGFVTSRYPELVRGGLSLQLTWHGCEFLAAVGNDGWRKKLTKEVGSVALEVVKTLGVAAGVKAGQELLGL